MRRPAIPWFTRKNFVDHRALDPAGLPPTYDEWYSRADQPVTSPPANVRVVINPRDFAAWCRTEGRKPDDQARAAFAQIVGNTLGKRAWWARRVTPGWTSTDR